MKNSDPDDKEDKDLEELIRGLHEDLDKQFNLFPFEDDDGEEITKDNCPHNNVYLNVISPTLQFKVCKDCGKEIKE